MPVSSALRISALLAAILCALPAHAEPQATSTPASEWTEAHKSRIRLLAGAMEEGGARHLRAFVEVELEPGWKTYWRNPGDSGGLPPTFDWSKSVNLARAEVRYPAPERMVDRSGTTLGYRGGAIFPVEIEPTDASRPVTLDVAIALGICKEICIPIETVLSLEVPPAAAVGAPPAEAADAVARVPRRAAERRAGDPELARVAADLAGSAPKLALEARYPGDAASADLLLEAPNGLYLPAPTRVEPASGTADGIVRFEVDLSRDVDLPALRGTTLTATMIGANGASEAQFKLE